MACGCVNNKNLNKDKLSLESMQTLSIDEIINLYRQGYILEGNDINETSVYNDIYSQTNIQSLTLSSPDLRDATGHYSSATGISYALWIWTNSGGYGYTSFEFYRPGTTTIISRTTCCYPTKTGPLKYLHTVEMYPIPILNNYDMIAFRCSSDTQQTCPPESDPNCLGTCSYPGAYTFTDQLLGMSIRAYNGTILPAPATLTITPGDGNLNLQWPSVTDAFAYYIEIKRVTVLIDSGYVTSSENTGQVTISGLTNGLLYDISVKAVSHSNIMGYAKTGSGTPGVTCQSITLTQPSPSTVTKGALVRLTANTTPTTQQFTIEFRDQDNILLESCLTSGGTCFIDWDTSTITATLPKTYNITAKVPGTPCVSDIVNVIVNPIAITCQSISNVVADPPTLTLGGTVILTATVTPSATTTQEFDVDFKDGTTTLNTTPITTVNHIATFNWIPATSKTYSIKAYSGICVSQTATPVIVNPVPTCTSLSLTSPSTGVRGGSITLSATISPVASGVGVVFKDDTTTLATRSTDGNGIATYIWAIPTNAVLGNHTISASVPGTTCTDSKVVSILSQILTTITISPPSQSISVGSTIPLTAVCKDLNVATMTCPILAWLSSNPAKATVDASGLVTGIAEGTANVTASASGVTSDASVITVTTAPPPQAGGGGAMVIAAVALLAAVMFMARKPHTPPT